jgi:hypothetical protein
MDDNTKNKSFSEFASLLHEKKKQKRELENKVFQLNEQINDLKLDYPLYVVTSEDNKYKFKFMLEETSLDRLIFFIDENKGEDNEEDWYASSKIYIPIKHIDLLIKQLTYFLT